MSKFCASALVVLLVGACSAPESGSQVAGDSPTTVASPTVDEPGGKGAPRAEPKERKARAGRPSGAQAGEKGGPQRGTRRASGESSVALIFPATGRYSFTQSGWEEFCQTTCDREDLPPRQVVDVFHRSTRDDSALVETFTRQSDDRESRSTTRYSPSRALITELFSRVTYEGLTFSDSIHPDPPILSATFPLEVGDSWSGSWKDDTSGDYRVAIVDRTVVAGHETFAVESTTTFSGRYEGEAVLDAWIDPDTNMILKTRGRFEIQSNFGSYKTRFVATIESGPGYR